MLILYFACVVIILGLIYAFLVEPRLLRLKIVEVRIKDLPDVFDGYRIALLSDFHYPRFTTTESVRKSVTMANSFQPDLIAITGDICDKHRYQHGTVPDLSGLFDHAQARDGVVGVLGNHDHWWDADQVRERLAQNTPVILIENSSFCVERNGAQLAIGGVGDLWEGVVAPEIAFSGVPDHIPRILLSHNPDVAEDMDLAVRIDLQLSGHTHGGQVCIPFGPALTVPSRYGNKFRAGLVQGKHHRVYVTRGVCSAHHVRFCCAPEVTGIILRKG